MRPPQEIIYRYVESGLPVLLLFQNGTGHVVCAFGHSYSNKRLCDLQNNVAFVPEVIIHNDEKGPYQKLELWGEALNSLVGIVVLLPEKVYLKGEDAEESAKNYVKKLYIKIYQLMMDKLLIRKETIATLKEFCNLFKNELEIENNLNKFILRTYLIASNKFKSTAIRNPLLSEQVKAFYSLTALPKYIWVTEISTEKFLSQAESSQRMLLGEIIQDATASPYSDSLLAAHFPGCLIINEAGKEKVNIIEDDRPYPQYTREN
jgi:hypothetical protein